VPGDECDCDCDDDDSYGDENDDHSKGRIAGLCDSKLEFSLTSPNPERQHHHHHHIIHMITNIIINMMMNKTCEGGLEGRENAQSRLAMFREGNGRVQREASGEPGVGVDAACSLQAGQQQQQRLLIQVISYKIDINEKWLLAPVRHIVL
jgi:hypothetical protein